VVVLARWWWCLHQLLGLECLHQLLGLECLHQLLGLEVAASAWRWPASPAGSCLEVGQLAAEVPESLEVGQLAVLAYLGGAYARLEVGQLAVLAYLGGA
jgi:hypothetical protein